MKIQPRTFAIGAAVFALLLGVLFMHRHVVLKVPKLGFVLYAILGGPVPPYMDDSIYLTQNQDQWRSTQDVFVSVPGKSGTTWMMNTLHHIRYRGAPPQFRDLYEECMWIEFVYYPGQPIQERISLLQNYSHKHPFPIYKTHLGARTIQYREDARYVVQARNILDVSASLYSFFRSLDAGFAQMWGGFPANAGQEETPKEMLRYEHALLVDMGNGKPMLDELVLNLLAEFWPLRHRENVQFFHYNDRLRTAKHEIARLAKFVGVANLTDEEIALVELRTSFAEMKREAEKFDMQHVLDPYREMGKVPSYVKRVANGLVNVGPFGVGKQALSAEFEQRIVQHVLKRFGEEITLWLMEGGELPIDADL